LIEVNPKSWAEPTFGVLFMKLKLEQKIQIYNEWKLEHFSLSLIA